MSVEFDSQCCTTQPEDVLQLYIKNRNGDKSANHETSPTTGNATVGPSTAMPSQQQPGSSTATTSTGVLNQNELTTQKYTPVLKKFSGVGNWPRQNVILPGNEVLFSLETASDYVKDDKVKYETLEQ